MPSLRIPLTHDTPCKSTLCNSRLVVYCCNKDRPAGAQGTRGLCLFGVYSYFRKFGNSPNWWIAEISKSEIFWDLAWPRAAEVQVQGQTSCGPDLRARFGTRKKALDWTVDSLIVSGEIRCFVVKLWLTDCCNSFFCDEKRSHGQLA